jgi:hypothetical protein
MVTNWIILDNPCVVELRIFAYYAKEDVSWGGHNTLKDWETLGIKAYFMRSLCEVQDVKAYRLQYKVVARPI